ncbi:MAG: hypothetical protein PHU80_06895, partial [Kiritimatiellae bacterium]|nr:hypothetical protein [Kiritimatiellia bacterium]
DLSDASGTNSNLIATARGVWPSFRRPLALVPGWEDMDMSLRGVRQNEGSVFIGGGQGVYLKAPELGARLDACGAFTVEGWWRMAGDIAGAQSWFLFGASGWALEVQEDSGVLRLCLCTDGGSEEAAKRSVIAAAEVAKDYAWKHVALSRKVTGDQAVWNLYVGGVGCGIATTDFSRIQAGAKSDFYIGGNPDAEACFHGQLDLWRVSDVALSPADFLPRHAPQTLAYWPLDRSEQGGTDFRDRSGSGRHLSTGRDGGVSGAESQALDSLPGAASLKTASLKNAGSLRFDGSLGQRSLLKAPGLGVSCELTKSFTVEGWFKKDGDPADRFWILAGARDSANGWLLGLREDSGRTRFYLFVSDVVKGGRLQFERFFSNADVTADSAWHHVALVYDHTAAGKGVWQLFLDGVWQSSVVNPGAPDRAHGFPDLTIGGRDSFSNSFVGWLDAWRVTDGPLAAEQLLCALPDAQPRTPSLFFDDSRNVGLGVKVENLEPCRQPFFMVNRDGHWSGLAVTETVCGDSKLRQLVSAVSLDKGRSWSSTAAVETGNILDDNWVSGLVTPFGRVYAFYAYCGDGVQPLDDKDAANDSSVPGSMFYKYSDDNGMSWSRERYRVPLRVTQVDRSNPWNGEHVLFRCAGKPVLFDQDAIFAVTKSTGSAGADGEGWAVASDNILTERNPGLVRFRLLPEGEVGIRRPDSDGRQSEHQLTVLSGGTLMCVYNEGGYVAQSFSRDSGKSWSRPEPSVFGTRRRRIKSGGMAPRVFRTSDGQHLLCFSNSGEVHGGTDAGVAAVFVCGGVEGDDGALLWTEPELLLYASATANDFVVADMIEQEGRLWFAAVSDGKVSLTEMRPELLAGIMGGVSGAAVCRSGLLSEALLTNAAPSQIEVPDGFGGAEGGGFSIEMRLFLEQLDYGTVLFSNFDGRRGVKVEALKKAGGVTLRITLFDGDLSAAWQTAGNVIKLSESHHVVFICDFAAGLVAAVVDGCFGEGETQGGRGWVRLPADFGPVVSSRHVARVSGGVKLTRLFNRALRTFEAAGNFHGSKER